MYDDGFNERTNYIHNSLDKNKVEQLGPSEVDSSLAQMNSESHKNDVKTSNTNQGEIVTDLTGTKDDYVLRNKNMINAQNMFRSSISNNMFGNKNQ